MECAMAAKRGERRAQLDALGIDAVCARIEAGESLSAIAAGAGVGIATLHQWIGADAERSARARDARERSAHAYADLAEQAIDAIADDATHQGRVRGLPRSTGAGAGSSRARVLGRCARGRSGAGAGPVGAGGGGGAACPA